METFIINWIKMKILKKIKQKIVSSKIIKGKMTYSGISLIVAAILAPVVGVDAEILSPDILEVIQGVGSTIALVGYYRRKHAPEVLDGEAS